MKNRRLGTFTLGVSLVITGLISIITLFTDIISILIVLKLSPIILIFLGAEMLLHTLKGNDVIKYDGLAFFLSFVLITGTLLSTAAVVLIDYYKIMI